MKKETYTFKIETKDGWVHEVHGIKDYDSNNLGQSVSHHGCLIIKFNDKDVFYNLLEVNRIIVKRERGKKNE